MAKFFDTYKDDKGGDGVFLTSEEKELLIEEGVNFPVTSVSSSTTQYGPRWVVGIELEGEPRMVGFAKGKVFSRDRMLAALASHLDEGGEPPEVKIVLNGRSQVFVDAEPEEA